MPFPLDQYNALRSGRGFAELTNWSSVTISGGDRQTFLHNFCTNDVRQLAPGQCCEAFVTNVKGKILGHGLVTCRDEELVFITVPGQAPPLIEHLDRYVIREDVQVRDTTSERAYLLVAGGAAARDELATLFPSLAADGSLHQPLANAAANFAGIPVDWIHWDLLGAQFCGLLGARPADVAQIEQALVDRGAVRCGEAALAALRIEAGTPLYDIDFDAGNLPQEVGRNDQAISFTKGCYLGQETVARIDALGHVNQQLAGVRFDGSDVPENGTALTHSGTTVGHVTSATYSPRLHAPLALAMVRREWLPPGTRLESAVGPCEVIALPVDQ